MSQNLLPVFVYGTLRSGCGNYSFFLDGFTTSEQGASLASAVMKTNGGFPYVYFDGDNHVVGELMYLAEDTYLATVAGLDGLEGYHGYGDPYNHYNREVVEVVTEAGETVQAYTYIAAEQTIARIADLPVVADGDWQSARQQRFASRY